MQRRRHKQRFCSPIGRNAGTVFSLLRLVDTVPPRSSERIRRFFFEAVQFFSLVVSLLGGVVVEDFVGVFGGGELFAAAGEGFVVV